MGNLCTTQKPLVTEVPPSNNAYRSSQQMQNNTSNRQVVSHHSNLTKSQTLEGNMNLGNGGTTVAVVANGPG